MNSFGLVGVTFHGGVTCCSVFSFRTSGFQEFCFFFLVSTAAFQLATPPQVSTQPHPEREKVVNQLQAGRYTCYPVTCRVAHLLSFIALQVSSTGDGDGDPLGRHPRTVWKPLPHWLITD